MAFEDIREYFTRHFLGRVQVHTTEEIAFPAPEIFTLRREVETYPLRTRMEIRSPALLSFQGGLQCSNNGFRFSTELVQVHGERVRRYVPKEMAVGSAPLRRKLKPKEGLKRALVIPHERTNRLQWQTHQPRGPGEMILAWYGPIIEGAVVKLALNRQRGTLLIWYNPQSRHSKAGGVYLYRRLGVKEPEWRWV